MTVESRGRMVADHYPTRHALAQTITKYDYFADNVLRDRVSYGGPKRHCSDCGVDVGEFHLPGCGGEVCPKCTEQAISCGCACEYDERSFEYNYDEPMRLKVTLQDIEDAISIAEIFGGYTAAFPSGDANNDLCCLVNSTLVYFNQDHCPSCTCKVEGYGSCDHEEGGWECIAAALDATPEAMWLQRITSHAVDDLFPGTREGDKGPPAICRWIDTLVDETSRLDRGVLNPDLESAELLRDGLLPPGVSVVPSNQQKPSRTRKNHS